MTGGSRPCWFRFWFLFFPFLGACTNVLVDVVSQHIVIQRWNYKFYAHSLEGLRAISTGFDRSVVTVYALYAMFNDGSVLSGPNYIFLINL